MTKAHAPSSSEGHQVTNFRHPQVSLSLVMPAYNEGSTIRKAVHTVLAADYPCDVELIVVNDGSTDDTLEQLAEIDDPRIKVLSHPRNLGKGAAVMTGLAAATGTHLMPFDADLEYSPTDIPRLLQPIIEGHVEVVYGTRLFGLNTRYHSFRYKLGNRATTLAANLLFDSAVTDIHTCLKLVPVDMLRRMPLTEVGFGLDSEITAHVLRAGVRPFEVPVAYYARSHAQGKKIRWKDGVHCIEVLTRVRMQPDLTRRPAAAATTQVVLPEECVNCGHPTLPSAERTIVDMSTRPVRNSARRRAHA